MSTMITVATAPQIVCPDWCVSSEADHVERLRDNDGVVHHDSDWVGGLSFTTVTVGA